MCGCSSDSVDAERRVVVVDFCFGHARSDAIQNHADHDPCPLNNGLAVAHQRIPRDQGLLLSSHCVQASIDHCGLRSRLQRVLTEHLSRRSISGTPAAHLAGSAVLNRAAYDVITEYISRPFCSAMRHGRVVLFGRMMRTDSRLVSLYDSDNPDGPDHDYYRSLIETVDPSKVIDLGCGTGILTVTLKAPRRQIVGVDPDDGMLDFARQREGADHVQWVTGDARSITEASADVVLMTGNVAQHIAPSSWLADLRCIGRGLKPGGTLSFETRNPSVEAWRSWASPEGSSVRRTPHGMLSEWMEVTEPDEHGVVVLTAHNLFEADPEPVTITQPLVFRTLPRIRHDLVAAGFASVDVRGDWQGGPVSEYSPLFVVVATKGLST